ncbi:RING-H2 finger protein ATL7 [Striga hermonthica]|uniref:RING-type E3 ubiquitin transferase n=1 Tax=Striga hermonthica TaxID=68872 RepID=A0A9N7RNQ1_STRHE|nr:RING-H2 finger protein ATL7 [Striga hermonthica]
MRTSNTSMLPSQSNDLSRCEMGLKKELREMLPIIVFKKSFFVKETQCSVCLGDYLGEDRLQQIPACGHTFHMYCIDLWLSTHTTCPLCRQSLLAASTKAPDSAEGFETSSLHVENDDEMSRQQTNEDPQTSQQPPESEDRDERVVPTVVQYAEVERGTETAK